MTTLTATKWDTVSDKEKFIAQFKKFVNGGFKRRDFTEAFYTRLSNCFSHIAHYDIHGFYSTWFITTGDQVDFIKNTLNQGGYGDPEYTYSDAEKIIKSWVFERQYLQALQEKAYRENETLERAELARLQEKYNEVQK